MSTENTQTANSVHIHCGILAVHMDDLSHPLAKLCHGVNQLDNLMAGLPFQTKIIRRDFVEHHFPCFGIETDVAGAVLPVTAHGAVFNGNLQAFFRSTVGNIGKHLFEFGHRLFHGLALISAGKGTHHGSAEQRRHLYHMAQGFPMVGIFNGIAVIAQGSHPHTGAVQHVLHFICQFCKVCSAQ